MGGLLVETLVHNFLSTWVHKTGLFTLLERDVIDSLKQKLHITVKLSMKRQVLLYTCLLLWLKTVDLGFYKIAPRAGCKNIFLTLTEIQFFLWGYFWGFIIFNNIIL